MGLILAVLFFSAILWLITAIPTIHFGWCVVIVFVWVVFSAWSQS